MEDDDRSIENHPDLRDPEWQKHAQLDAWLGAKKDMQKRRKRERRAAGGYRAPGQSRWPGVLALLIVVGLIAAAIVVHQVQGPGVNEPVSVFKELT